MSTELLVPKTKLSYFEGFYAIKSSVGKDISISTYIRILIIAQICKKS